MLKISCSSPTAHCYDGPSLVLYYTTIVHNMNKFLVFLLLYSALQCTVRVKAQQKVKHVSECLCESVHWTGMEIWKFHKNISWIE